MESISNQNVIQINQTKNNEINELKLILDKISNLDYHSIAKISEFLASRICLKIKNHPGLSKDKALNFFRHIIFTIHNELKDYCYKPLELMEEGFLIDPKNLLSNLSKQFDIILTFPENFKIKLYLDLSSSIKQKELIFKYTERQKDALICLETFTLDELLMKSRL